MNYNLDYIKAHTYGDNTDQWDQSLTRANRIRQAGGMNGLNLTTMDIYSKKNTPYLRGGLIKVFFGDYFLAPFKVFCTIAPNGKMSSMLALSNGLPLAKSRGGRLQQKRHGRVVRCRLQRYSCGTLVSLELTHYLQASGARAKSTSIDSRAIASGRRCPGVSRRQCPRLVRVNSQVK